MIEHQNKQLDYNNVILKEYQNMDIKEFELKQKIMKLFQTDPQLSES